MEDITYKYFHEKMEEHERHMTALILNLWGISFAILSIPWLSKLFGFSRDEVLR